MKKELAILSFCLIQFIFGVPVFAQKFELTPTIPVHALGNKTTEVVKKQLKDVAIGDAVSRGNILKSISSNQISKIWGKYLSTSYDDRFYASAIDNNGNVISVGSIGVGTSDCDALIYKCDASGNKLWSIQPATSSSNDAVYDVATDKARNIFITGEFSNSAFSSSLYSNGDTDAFIAKYDPDGNLVWVNQGGGSDDDYGCGIKTDENGDVYVVGFFNGTAYFNNVYKTSSSQGDMFIAKYDGANGNLVWVKTGNIGENNYLFGIGVDPTGHVYVGTNFSGSVSFSGSPIVNSTGDNDMLLIKYDTYGTFQWVKTGGGIGNDGINRTAICADGNILVAGYFSGTAQFGTKTLTSHGSFDIFAVKYSPSGNIIWAKQFGGTDSQSAWSICPDEKNNCYITGWFSGTGAFDNTTIYSSGKVDAYLIKYDKNGNLIWVEPIATGDDNQYGNSVSVAGNDIIVAGRYNGDSYIYNSSFLNEGGEDGFIAKFIQSEDPNNQVTINPNLILSASLVKTGQSVTFSGKQFSPAGKIDLNFIGPGILNPIIDYSIDAYGNFDYTITIPYSQNSGTYQVTVTDKISGLSTSKMFQVIQNQSNVVDDFLKIIEPNMSKIRLVGDPITLAWEDQVKYNVNPPYNFKDSYKVEYKKDANNSSGAWQQIENIQGINLGYGKINHSTSFTPSDAGTYAFRITDNYYPNRSVTTSQLVVSGSLNQDIRVEFKWDYNSKGMGTSPEGVTADGVARFYVVVSNSNPSSSVIQKVKVSISDPEEYTSTQFLGKLMKCSYQSDDKFISEADNANSISAENNTPNSKGQYWFWYVAPDDFSRNQGDWDKGERKIAVNFEISLANGKTIPSFKKEITIVRPPLMLVHGLNGAPDSWDKFHLGIENPLYINDPRFKIKKAVYMLPTAHFNVNSSTLLAGSENKNSFMWFVNEMREKGYACSQVDYVCHSMGGSIFRDAVENTASYKRENNYRKGFVNKCITINTPHQGSSFANVLEDVSKIWVLTGPIISLGAINDLFDINFLSIKVVDAVEDLKNRNGIKFNITDVPSHLIGGGVSCREFNTFTFGTYEFLKTYLGTMTFSSFLDQYSWYNLYFKLRGYESDFMDSSDAVVSLTSQFSGYTGNSLPDFCTRTSGTMHNSTFGVSPMASSEVWERVNELLNTKENSVLFNSMPSTKVSGTKSAPYTPKQTLALIDDKVKILYPSQNAVYQTGDTMTIKLKVDTIGMKSFAVFFQDQSFFEKPSKTNLEYKLIVSPEYIEGQSISVLGGYFSQGSNSISKASIDLTVKPVGLIVDFNVTPEVFVIEKSKSRRPDYEAIFPNAIAQIGQTDLFTVAIKNPEMLAYDNATNQFKGLAKGSTNATITYKGITKTVFFEIIQYEEPQVDPVTDVNDIKMDKKDLLNVKVYPNPVTNELTIEFEGNSVQTNFEILNSLGQVIFKGTIFEKAVIQTTSFTPGIYLIKLQSGKTFEFKKIIKN